MFMRPVPKHFTTLASRRRAKNCAAPAELCRRKHNHVRVKCFQVFSGILERLTFRQTRDAEALMLITSALKRAAASSKDTRVRVLGSTKEFTNVFPRSAGTFLMWRVPTVLKASAVWSKDGVRPPTNIEAPPDPSGSSEADYQDKLSITHLVLLA